MAVRKEDYLDWLRNSVTKEAAKDVATSVENAVANLVKSRDNTQQQDAFQKGYISGVQALLDWEPELLEEDVNVKD